MDNSAKPETFKWTHKLTMSIINLIGEYYSEFLIGVKKRVFQKIAAQLNRECDWKLTWDQCENKWKGLHRQYNKMKQQKSIGNDIKYWIYYNYIDAIVKGSHETIAYIDTPASDGFKEIIKMTEKSSNPETVRKIKTQKDEEEENFYIVEELDEIENPLELEATDYVDFEVSMDATNEQESNSEDEDRALQSSPSYSRSMAIRRTWDYAETKEMLTVFIENKRYIDRLMKVKDKYEFIAKKLNDRNPDQLINSTAIENKIKALIRTYRANRSRKYVAKTDIDRYLEEIYGIGRLLKRDDVKTEVFQKNFDKSGIHNMNDDYFGDGDSTNVSDASLTTAGPSLPKKIKFFKNSDSQTTSINRQTQATQTDLGDNMLMQLVQIDKNQQKRWEEEKALIARIERAKAERFTRKESLLQELVNVLKSKLH